ncbi:two-component system sensor histidine kinase NtrB [Bacillus alkalisoli]|uniref:two-component system sensor histidine kinase NtrB n=1 Tax=Bacillus alkalisoli TaxID=2011008 RepID=UPI000C23974A|nr:ATP-binding protein [Bacillus alkalisoli]
MVANIEKSHASILNELREEIVFVLHLNGTIEEFNNLAKEIFQTDLYDSASFYSLFTQEIRNDVYTFLDQIISGKGDVLKRILIHSAPQSHPQLQNEFYLYKGKLYENKIYLQAQKIPVRDNQLPIQLLGGKTQESVRLLQFITVQLDLAIFVISDNGIIQYLNKKSLNLLNLPLQQSKYIDVSLLDIPANEILKNKFLAIHEEIVTENSFVERYFYLDDQLLQVQGLYFQEENRTLFIIHDRSYQHKFENLLIYKQQMESVSQISAGMAHELRNPLSVIKGFIQLSQITNEWEKYYPTVLDEINRMNDIIEDFLSVSKKKLTKQSMKPQDLFQSLVYIFQSECLLHNVQFDCYIEPIEEELLVNESMIKQVMLNLLRNSIEALEEIKKDKRIEMKVVRSGNCILVSVKDNGPGIDEKTLEKIGQPFFTTKQNGNGLGVPLCKKIIEDHDGELKIDTELKEGTTFTFSLPLSKSLT